MLEKSLPIHLSIYLALFCSWQQFNYQTPFNISRSKIMGMAKVRVTTTYHKCIHNMSNFGFIEYKPTYNPLAGSKVKFIFHINDLDLLL